MGFVFGVLFLFLNATTAFAEKAIQKTTVTVQIVLAVDVSASVDEDEYALQKQGIVDALLSHELSQLVDSCNEWGVGVTYIEWSGDTRDSVVQQVVPWTHIMNGEDFKHFVDRLQRASRSSIGQTDVGLSLEFSETLIASSPFDALRTVVSVSGDGVQNVTPRNKFEYGSTQSYVANIEAARDRLVAKGVIINTITIGDDFVQTSSVERGQATSLEEYFSMYVRGGPASFNLKAENYQHYSEMIKKQILRLVNNCIS